MFELTKDQKKAVADAEKYVIEVAGKPVINTPEEYAIISEKVKESKRKLDEIEALRVSIVKPFNDGVDRINALFKGPILKLKQFSIEGRAVMVKFKEDEQKKIDEAKRIADETARKERERLEKKAADDRKKAQEALDKGKDGKAQELLQKANMAQAQAEATVAAPVMQATKVEGVSYRTEYYVSADDPKAFAQYCINTNQMHYIPIDIKAIDSQANRYKGNIGYPGITVHEKKVSTIRT